jgi:hypothetical protein
VVTAAPLGIVPFLSCSFEQFECVLDSALRRLCVLLRAEEPILHPFIRARHHRDDLPLGTTRRAHFLNRYACRFRVLRSVAQSVD